MIAWEKKKCAAERERERWETEQEIIDMNHDQYTLFLQFILLHLQFVSENKLTAGKNKI